MREYIRHPSSIPITIKQSSHTERDLQTLDNIGLGGISCYSSVAMDDGDEVNLYIGYVDPPFEITGMVKWCRPEGEQFHVGIQFQGSDHNIHRVRMIEQVCHIEHYRNEVLQTENRELSSEEAAKEWIGKYASTFPR